ncbi:MAG: extracellular solute-binding protein [Candidatus Limnocylindrales bacterium]
MTHPRSRLLAAAASSALLLTSVAATAVAQGSTDGTVTGEVTVYTSVTQDTVDAVLGALELANPDLEVKVFRAPTGELDARLATEQRTGGIGADVLWMTDPLSVQRYEADGLLSPLEGEAFEVVPEAFRGETFVGTRLLNLVLVSGSDVEPPTSWADLVDPEYADGVVLPDPGFAGSAFAALGYLGTTEGFGMEFFEALEANGAVIVPSPVDTLTGVAEGIYDVGLTLDKIARDNIEDGAPIELVWPEPGAIALFSPAAIVAQTDAPEAAQAFLEFLVSAEGQAAIAGTGWQPVREDVGWPYEGEVVTADWAELDRRGAQLLEDFYVIFGD